MHAVRAAEASRRLLCHASYAGRAAAELQGLREGGATREVPRGSEARSRARPRVAARQQGTPPWRAARASEEAVPPPQGARGAPAAQVRHHGRGLRPAAQGAGRRVRDLQVRAAGEGELPRGPRPPDRRGAWVAVLPVQRRARAVHGERRAAVAGRRVPGGCARLTACRSRCPTIGRCARRSMPLPTRTPTQGHRHRRISSKSSSE